MKSKPASSSTADGVVADDGVDQRRPELWTRLAWLPLLALASSLIYLGVRPGGEGPIFVYMTGRLLIGLSAFVLFLWGLIIGAIRRPLIRRERVRAFVIVVAVLAVSNYPFPYPSSREGKPSQVEFRLPVEGEWVVLWGGEQKESNRLAGFYPDQRWGMHLVREVNGSSFEGGGEEAEQHRCYGEPVFAPSAGTVVRVVDGIVDGGALTASSEPFGNHLVIEVAEGEYLFLTQLLAGSLVPAEGDRVEPGAHVARVGASGFSMVSPMPHLGLHLATSPISGRGEGIPWSFHGYMSDGTLYREGLPIGGVARDGRFTGARVAHGGPHEAD
jgi:hypothetical protein